MNNVVRMPGGAGAARQLRADPPDIAPVVVSFTPPKPPEERPPYHSLASRFDPRSRPFLIALALSLLLHAALIPLFVFRGTFEEPKEPPKPKIIVVELAALGTPKAPEAKPEPPAPPPEPAPPPPQQEAPAVQPPPEPTPPQQVEPQPPPLAAEPEAVPILPPVRPQPKPEPPKAPEPPKVAPPPPQVTAPPPQPAPQVPPPQAAAPQLAAPAATAPTASAQTQTEGIETGVEGAKSQDEMNRYVTTLFTMIDRKKVYPSPSMRRHEEGTVTVRLTIARDGTLVDVISPTTSPQRLVDASLDAVREAAPFPPLPQSLKEDKAVFEVPVTYRLQ